MQVRIHLHILAAWAAVLVLAACQTAPGPAPPGEVQATAEALAALHGPVPDHEVVAEAHLLAARSHAEAQALAATYQVGTPAWMHNVMVNAGVRDRGLCWQYMEDLFLVLAAENPRHFDLHCGVRDRGNLLLEHHCVVVTAVGSPFSTGLVLDPWKKPGKLLHGPTDEKPDRPWIEDAPYRRHLDRRAVWPAAR